MRLSKENTGLIVIDVQEKLFAHVERACDILHHMQKVIKGFQIFDIPVVVTEQYPQGLGETVKGVMSSFCKKPLVFTKTSFSCVQDSEFEKFILSSAVTNWVLVGIEAHVCVLQSAYDLIQKGLGVTVLNDAISSRSIYDYSTAIAEMRDLGVRISSAETVLFELVKDAKTAEFKQISELVR